MVCLTNIISLTKGSPFAPGPPVSACWVLLHHTLTPKLVKPKLGLSVLKWIHVTVQILTAWTILQESFCRTINALRMTSRSKTQLISGFIALKLINACELMSSLSFLCRFRLCVLCDGCFLSASDLIQEVAWRSAHTEFTDDQKKAHLKTPSHSRADIWGPWLSCSVSGRDCWAWLAFDG